MFGVLNQLLYGGSIGFRSYEAQCIERLAEQLPEEAKNILRAQLRKFEKISRSVDDQLVEAVLPLRRSRVPSFPNQGAELSVARLIVLDRAGAPLTCDFIFHRGDLFHIMFGAPPEKRLSEGFSVSQIEIYEDVMNRDARNRKPRSSALGNLPEKLRNFPVTNCAEPASSSDVEKIARRLAPSLPSDYVDLLRLTDGFTLEPWDANGLRTWTIVHPEGIFTYLAEGWDLSKQDPHGLAIRHQDSAPTIYLHDKIGDSFSPMGDSFIDALIWVTTELDEIPTNDYELDQPGMWPPAPRIMNSD